MMVSWLMSDCKWSDPRKLAAGHAGVASLLAATSARPGFRQVAGTVSVLPLSPGNAELSGEESSYSLRT